MVSLSGDETPRRGGVCDSAQRIRRKEAIVAALA
jgi:hypothetical protein